GEVFREPARRGWPARRANRVRRRDPGAAPKDRATGRIYRSGRAFPHPWRRNVQASFYRSLRGFLGICRGISALQTLLGTAGAEIQLPKAQGRFHGAVSVAFPIGLGFRTRTI